MLRNFKVGRDVTLVQLSNGIYHICYSGLRIIKFNNENLVIIANGPVYTSLAI